ncbi:hypothetical protein T4B_2336 [Trichinella pseudospiralis]|uniref:Uncharacterized protein n=2 Tax=Trichinella pseudospiralis TaxID=6337 RepID=A0A0V1G2B4_TRIPS|nr:hypothetical protein T4D_8153 [Trichinella pseudospiralis]KRZ33325.1 hypothetical protein T4B_2336 [Trichinella pseudospiralis]KRZ43793.1 hypothetical protein T4C_10660 [Trichinella pseudospiralis]
MVLTMQMRFQQSRGTDGTWKYDLRLKRTDLQLSWQSWCTLTLTLTWCTIDGPGGFHSVRVRTKRTSELATLIWKKVSALVPVPAFRETECNPESKASTYFFLHGDAHRSTLQKPYEAPFKKYYNTVHRLSLSTSAAGKKLFPSTALSQLISTLICQSE